jgi:transposase
MNITRVGLDIAKQVFQVHGVDEYGKVRARKQLARAKVLEFFVQLPPCLIGIEACASSHYWGRELSKLGHTVKLMAAQFAYLRVVDKKADAKSAWARRLKERRHVNVAAVALAAKHARIAWAILAHGTEYRPAGPEVVAA